MTEHIQNADAQEDKEDRKLRIVKHVFGFADGSEWQAGALELCHHLGAGHGADDCPDLRENPVTGEYVGKRMAYRYAMTREVP